MSAPQSIVHQLYLSTSYGSNRYDVSNLSAAKWLVDWDTFFRGDNYNYDKCRIRFNLVSEAVTSANFSYTNAMGVLSSSFAGQYTFGGPGTVLGLLTPSTIATDINEKSVNVSCNNSTPALQNPTIVTPQGNVICTTTATSTTTGYNTQILSKAYNCSTMMEQGVNAAIPQGQQVLTLSIAGNFSNDILTIGLPAYQILLSFELYDPKTIL